MKKYESPILTNEVLLKLDVMAASGDDQQDQEELLNENPLEFSNLQNHGVFSKYYE